MGLFGNRKEQNKPERASVVSLAKGKSVTLSKTPLIIILTSWTNPKKDYDVMALVKYRDGHIETVCAVNNEHPVTTDGAVKHLGDVGVSGAAGTETIEVRLNDNIVEIVPFAYSAIENGPGSFQEYGVSVAIDNGSGDLVNINATDTSPERHRYTLAFGRIVNGDVVTIENLEMYSKNHSEWRPAYVGNKLTMDAGPQNREK